MIEEVVLYRKKSRKALKRPTLKKKSRKYQSTAKGVKSRQKPKSRLQSVSKLKKTLEALQKQLVIKTYGRDCYTCNQKDLQGANCQLGHVPWPRTILSTVCKFDIRFTRIQCFRCNIHLGGMGGMAYERMRLENEDLFGMALENEQTKGKVVPRQWYLDKIAEYEALVDNLLKEN